MKDFIFVLNNSPYIFMCFVGISGLIIGSFLNVVCARLPKMLSRTWKKECYEYLNLAIPAEFELEIQQKYNLVVPRSHCPNCNKMITAFDNIPLLSFLVLKAACRNCGTKISFRYPVIEALTAVLFMIVAWRYGVSMQTAAGCILSALLIAQSTIDLDHMVIPDEITIPALWLGLLFNLNGTFVTISDAIIGAVFGYLVLWGFYHLFLWATKKEGMGYGDFKLTAMFGAWLGWQVLPFTITFAAILGGVFGIVMLFTSKIQRNTPIPFGPYLAFAAWLSMIWGNDINNWYLGLSGIY